MKWLLGLVTLLALVGLVLLVANNSGQRTLGDYHFTFYPAGRYVLEGQNHNDPLE